MPFSKNFTMGSIFPYDAHAGFAYTPREIQKTLPVTLDAHFLDPITGAYVSRAIYAQQGGEIALEFLDGTTDVLPILAAVPLKIIARRVISVGTTATGLHWGY
jgi:hypothetical protein